MNYFLVAILFLPLLWPSEAVAITGGSARFDFATGVPSLVDNQTSLCNSATTVRYDFTSGAPGQVFDTTATCTAATTGPKVILKTRLITPFGGRSP
jgi:hypothetical protein